MSREDAIAKAAHLAAPLFAEHEWEYVVLSEEGYVLDVPSEAALAAAIRRLVDHVDSKALVIAEGMEAATTCISSGRFHVVRYIEDDSDEVMIHLELASDVQED